MGIGNSITSDKEHTTQVLVKTGEQFGQGTDSNVYVIFHDKSGRKTKTINLQNNMRNDFERGHTDNFPVKLRSEDGTITLSEITYMEIWRDPFGINSNWFCDVVILLDLDSGLSIPFPIQRWIKPNFRYQIKAYDTILPQDDPNPGQRSIELDDRKSLYQYSAKDHGLPGMIQKIPDDEKFTTEFYMKVFAGTTIYGKFMSMFINVGLPSKWKSADDIKKAFNNDTFDLPRCSDFWNEDEWFGAQRLAGINPCSIKLCTEVPEKFAVDKDALQPLMENQDLETVLGAKKLFIVDHKILDGLKGVHDRALVAPMGLFYLNSSETLMPVALQLQQNGGPDNPVFYPSDDKNVWTLAKMWFNMGDAHVHQAVCHLGLTHLSMETISIATHRCLAPNHPVFRLLGPHFFYLFAINQAGLAALVKEGTALDTLSNLGGQGALELIRRTWATWRLDVEGTFPRELESRGVLDEAVLPVYPYRDDAILLHEVIKEYVRNVLVIYYGDDESTITRDHELQDWGKLMSTPVDQHGGGVKGLPNDGNFRSVEDVVTVCTSIIFVCSVQHAAINFPQYDLYAFAPNQPVFMAGQPPKNKDPISEEQIVQKLCKKDILLFAMQLSKTLSQKAARSLGEWDVRFQFDRQAVAAEFRFREELLRVGDIIRQRNQKRSKFLYYDYLDPEFITNSISM